MISKELLSEVLHGSRIIIKDLRNMENCLEYVSYCSINEMNGTKHNENLPDNYYVVKADRWQEINIYELAHKCKEWAFKQGYELFSRILSNDNQMRGNCLVIRVESDPETVLTITNADTEPEAIFQACQWILKGMK